MTSGDTPGETAGSDPAAENGAIPESGAVPVNLTPGAPTAAGGEAAAPSIAGVSGGSGGTGGTDEAAGVGGTGGGPATVACSPARPHAMGTSTVNLQSGGVNRSYLLHIPPAYDGSEPLALVLDVLATPIQAAWQRAASSR